VRGEHHVYGVWHTYILVMDVPSPKLCGTKQVTDEARRKSAASKNKGAEAEQAVRGMAESLGERTKDAAQHGESTWQRVKDAVTDAYEQVISSCLPYRKAGIHVIAL
jgi:hypothetical protein